MNNDKPRAQRMVEKIKQASSPASVGVPLMAVIALGLWMATRIVDLGTRFLDGLLLDTARNAEQIAELESALGAFRSTAEERFTNKSIQIDRLVYRVDKLANESGARPDPFTGTEGRELRHLIDGLERRIDELEKHQ